MGAPKGVVPSISSSSLLENDTTPNEKVNKSVRDSKYLELAKRSVVNSYSNIVEDVDVLYAINTKKEVGAAEPPRYANNSLSSATSDISKANLIEYNK